MKGAKAKILIGVVAAVAAVGIAVLVLLMNKTESYRVIKVFEIMGSTLVNRTTDVLDAYTGMNLENGDLVNVQSESSCRLELDSDKYILLDENSKLSLVADGNSSDSRTIINLIEGTILNEVTKPLSENSVYEVNAPKATMAVRGTSFSVSVVKETDNSYTSELNVYHGVVSVWLVDEKGKKKGDEIKVYPGKSVCIRTEPNEGSSNDPTVDGISFFVAKDSLSGEYVRLEDGVSPQYDSDYSILSKLIREQIIDSNDEDVLVVDHDVYRKLMGYTEEETESVSEEVSEESETVSETSAESETDGSAVLNTDINMIGSGDMSDSMTGSGSYDMTALADETEYVTTAVPVSDTDEYEEVTTVPNNDDEEEIEVTRSVTEADETVSEDDEISETSVRESSETERTTAESVTESTASAETTVTTVPTETESESKTSSTSTAPKFTTPSYTGTYPNTSYSPSVTEPVSTEYIVKYYYQNELIDQRSFKKGEYLTFPVTEDISGYDKIWMSGGNAVTGSTVVVSDMTIVLSYAEKRFTVTFVNGDSVVYTETVEYNGTVSEIPEIPEKEGYTGSWMVGETVFDPDTVITADVVVTAEYGNMTCVVTFIDDVSSSTVNVLWGKTVTPPSITPRAGYTAKWMADGVEFTSSTPVKSDITVKAVYTMSTVRYTVKFMNGNTVISEQTVESGKTVGSVPEVPEKEGLVGRWMYDGEVFSSDMPITRNIEVSLEYVEMCVVTFNITGYPSVITQMVEKNGTISNFPIFNEEYVPGYRLLGWYADPDYTIPVTSSTIVTGDMTVYAELSMIVTISFYADGELLDTVIIYYLDSMSTKGTEFPIPPEMSDKVFTGWATSDGMPFDENTIVSDDISVFAVYS